MRSPKRSEKACDRAVSGKNRHRLFGAALLTAGIVISSAVLTYGGRGGSAATEAGRPAHVLAEGSAPINARQERRRHEGGFAGTPPQASDVTEQDAKEALILRTLSSELPYGGMDCRMLPAAEAEALDTDSRFISLGNEYSLNAPYEALDGSSSASAAARESLFKLLLVYDKKDLWGVLAFVQYLDSLNLEDETGSLYESYEELWLGGKGTLPDPLCMERIAVAIQLSRMARYDLSTLLSENPEMASSVLGELAPQTREHVLSGAVGAALADPKNPRIDGLFGFLSTEGKIALIEMYDASLPEEERIGGTAGGGLAGRGEAELWGILKERMRRFQELQPPDAPQGRK